jgi:cyclic pyranopterin phosphate synthase
MIHDKFQRPVISARISITQRCNLDCIYCHREGIFEDSTEEMTSDEISRIIGICTKNGV